MIPNHSNRLDGFFADFNPAARPHLLLDYDGTLAAFRVDRFQSRPWAGVRELLAQIQADGRTRMAVITGRPAHEIAPMLALPAPLEVWGLHGAERLYPDGRRELEAFAPEAAKVLEDLRQQLHRDSLGGLFEDKPNAAVMHWRGFSRKQAAEIRRRAFALFEPLASLPGLRLLHFESGVELRAGRNKGGAVEAILSESDAGGPLAYLGDDLSDEAAFAAVQKQGERGLGVLMNRHERTSQAQIWLQPPAGMRDFLRRWIGSLAV